MHAVGKPQVLNADQYELRSGNREATWGGREGWGEREGERERELYIYIYTHIYMYISGQE